MKRSLFLSAMLLASPAVFAKPVAQITKVTVTKSGTSYDVTIAGRNFGSAPFALPCRACTAPELKFLNNANFRTSEAPDVLSWTDTAIKLSSVSGGAGDSISVVVTNNRLDSVAAAGGNFPGTHPHISRITFSGSGAALKIVVIGTGFGSAPEGVPGSVDIPYFQFLNWRPVNGYSAGYTGQGYTDTLTLNYKFWSDTQIVVDGFGAAYGEDGWTAKPGDPFVITVFETPGITPGQTGPQTSKGGALP